MVEKEIFHQSIHKAKSKEVGGIGIETSGGGMYIYLQMSTES
jgi:hypothetical protein